MSKLILTHQQIEELLVEIITGKKLFVYEPTGGIFAVAFPSVEDRDMARVVYARIYKQLQAEGLPTTDQMRVTIAQQKLLPDNYHQITATLESNIASSEKARDMTTDKAYVAVLNNEIEKLQIQLVRHRAIQETFFENTVDIKSEEVRLNYLVSRCTFFGEELSKRYWSSYDDYCKFTDKTFTNQARYTFYLLNAGVPSSFLRALARSSEWRQRWKIAKQTGTSVFIGNSAEWDKNKVALCYWSDFFDTILSYSTPPSDEIMEDDDKLFEWIRDVNRINASKASGQSTKAVRKGGTVTAVNSPYKVKPRIQSI